ncbi:CocE/NonD family hydrolase [Propionicicella superfundia]|uniref:CocE/NonD family hydrolase n=1 Tax=Propionicicella superfundia TaxID=348582 RepID=UPI00048DD728|nr:CocE/NonD family hydrolase [Propionicicella superfundia]
MARPRRVPPAPVPPDAREVQVPMRDGVRLATDLYLPDDGAPRTALLVRLPYDKDGEACFMPDLARVALRRGYAAVIQDVRGKYRSEGDTLFAAGEVTDGYDTIEWVAGQPWCDGSVVMWGDSYFGMTQLAAAAAGHPALRAIAPRLTGTQLGRVLPGEEGLTGVEQASFRELLALHFADPESIEWTFDWSARPLAAEFERYFGALGHRSAGYDRETRTTGGHAAVPIDQLLTASPVPTLFTVGWFDLLAALSWHDIDRLRANERWREHLFLRLEAIDHHNGSYADVMAEPGVADVPRTDAVAVRLLTPALDFFDHWAGHATAPARVTYEVCNGGWHEAAAWPPPGASTLTLYGGVTGATSGRGRLSTSAAEPGSVLAWVSDGASPVPSVSADPYRLLTTRRDLTADTDRPDIAVLDSDPFEAAVTLAGPVALSGELASDRPSTDLFVRMLDVRPSGEASLILRGEARFDDLAGWRRFRISLLHTGYRIRPGHRLRIQLACTDHPHVVLNPGDGGSGWDAVDAPRTRVQVKVGGAAGLHLELTVM